MIKQMLLSTGVQLWRWLWWKETPIRNSVWDVAPKDSWGRNELHTRTSTQRKQPSLACSGFQHTEVHTLRQFCATSGQWGLRNSMEAWTFLPEILTQLQNQKPAYDFLVVQWLRTRLQMQGTQVQSLVQEDSTCRGATKPVCRKRSHRNEKPTRHS